jgi:23S rRNA G2445 N2-methylase RlmL
VDGVKSYKAYKKDWIQRKQNEEKREVEKLAKEKLKGQGKEEPENEEQEGMKVMIKSLDQVRAEMQTKKEYQKGLKDLSRVMINIVKDKAEILLGTSEEELHKHGYKPFVRWGVLKETLTAACILESGIIRKANKTGKLYLWDPFCGSGSFVIETLMMLLDQPVRQFDQQLPFEHWPIHKREEYQAFKEDLNDF